MDSDLWTALLALAAFGGHLPLAWYMLWRGDRPLQQPRQRRRSGAN